MRKTTTFFVVLAVLLPAARAGAAANEATISNFSFSPSPVRIQVGATLKWTNLDSSAHTVTADDGSWTSTSLNKDGTFSRTFSQPGTVRYHCAIHESMTGTVEVETATATTAAPTTTTTVAPATTTTQAPTTSTAPVVTPTTLRNPKPSATSTTRSTAAPTTATTAPEPTTTTAPSPAAVPEDTTATTEAALDPAASHDGDSNAAPVAIGAALLLLGGAAGWWALRRRRSATG